MLPLFEKLYVCRTLRSTFYKSKSLPDWDQREWGLLFLFDFYIHTCIAISSVRLQAKSLLALTYIFIYCFFLFSLCLTWKFISQLTVDNFCSRKVFCIDMYIYYTWKKNMCVCGCIIFYSFNISVTLCAQKQDMHGHLKRKLQVLFTTHFPQSERERGRWYADKMPCRAR